MKNVSEFLDIIWVTVDFYFELWTISWNDAAFYGRLEYRRRVFGEAVKFRVYGGLVFENKVVLATGQDFNLAKFEFFVPFNVNSRPLTQGYYIQFLLLRLHALNLNPQL